MHCACCNYNFFAAVYAAPVLCFYIRVVIVACILLSIENKKSRRAFERKCINS